MQACFELNPLATSSLNFPAYKIRSSSVSDFKKLFSRSIQWVVSVVLGSPLFSLV